MATAETFEPINVNFWLLPPLVDDAASSRKRLRGRARKQALSARALANLAGWT